MNWENSNCEVAIMNPQRLKVLYDMQILDSPEDRLLDHMTQGICRDLDVPIALVTLIDKDRQFFKSQQGLDPEAARTREMPLSYSLCKYVVEQCSTIAIEDARVISALRQHPAIVENGVVAYLGAPLIMDGQVLGSVCAADNKARHWTEEQISFIERRANSIRAELCSHREKRQKFAAFR